MTPKHEEMFIKTVIVAVGFIVILALGAIRNDNDDALSSGRSGGIPVPTKEDSMTGMMQCHYAFDNGEIWEPCNKVPDRVRLKTAFGVQYYRLDSHADVFIPDDLKEK